jgi:hypothetical protein
MSVLWSKRLELFCWWRKPVESLLVLPMFCGFLAYGHVTNFNGLNPFETEWLLAYWKGSIDSAAHYLGWEFFRQAPLWQWPPGRSPNLGPIDGSGVGLTDSIPLFAFIFKPLTFWFTKPFQYFGIWVLTCFVLQAVFAWKLLTIWVKHWEHALLGTYFFCFAPIFLDRIIIHLAIAGHWVLLASLYLLLSDEFKFKRWLFVGVISALVQPYLAVIVSVLFFARLLIRFTRNHNAVDVLKYILVFCFSLFAALWSSGLFAFGFNQVQANGFGMFSSNLLSLVDPGYPNGERVPWSRFIPNPWQTETQYEGFNYIGTGVIALLIFGFLPRFVASSVKSRVTQVFVIAVFVSTSVIFGYDKLVPLVILGLVVSTVISFFFDGYPQKMRENIIIMLACLGLFVVGLSNSIYVGNYHVGNFSLPPFALQFFAVIRASGRMIWPLTFLVIAISIVLTSRFLGRLVASVALVGAIGLQAYDSIPAVAVSKSMFVREGPPDFLISPLWQEIGKRYSNILIVFPSDFPILQPVNPDFWAADYSFLWRELGIFALENDMSINAFYFMREAHLRDERASVDLRIDLHAGNIDPDTLYVFTNSHYWELLKRTHKDDDLIGILDTLPILAPGLSDCSNCDFEGFLSKG